MAKARKPSPDKELDAIALAVLPALIGRLPQAKGGEGTQVLVSSMGGFAAAQELAMQAYLIAHAMKHIRTLRLEDLGG